MLLIVPHKSLSPSSFSYPPPLAWLCLKPATGSNPKHTAMDYCLGKTKNLPITNSSRSVVRIITCTHTHTTHKTSKAEQLVGPLFLKTITCSQLTPQICLLAVRILAIRAHSFDFPFTDAETPNTTPWMFPRAEEGPREPPSVPQTDGRAISLTWPLFMEGIFSKTWVQVADCSMQWRKQFIKCHILFRTVQNRLCNTEANLRVSASGQTWDSHSVHGGRVSAHSNIGSRRRLKPGFLSWEISCPNLETCFSSAVG